MADQTPSAAAVTPFFCALYVLQLTPPLLKDRAQVQNCIVNGKNAQPQVVVASNRVFHINSDLLAIVVISVEEVQSRSPNELEGLILIVGSQNTWLWLDGACGLSGCLDASATVV